MSQAAGHSEFCTTIYNLLQTDWSGLRLLL